MFRNEPYCVAACGPLRAPARAARVGIALLLLLAIEQTRATAGDGDGSANAAPESATPTQPAAEGGELAEPLDPAQTIEERLHVVGSAHRAGELPGAGAFIGREELDKQAHGDIHRVLRRVPGVYMQEEEGYGLRPNIGLRGTGVERSSKITVLEDGVLISPAPYSAPAAYYFPNVGRMEGVEVRKGSSSIKQGPYTNGGVINLISRRIPTSLTGQVRASFGDDALSRVHAWAGTALGPISFVAETFRFETDGFKRLDGGRDTGVTLQDWLLKLRYTTDDGARIPQVLELKLSRTDQAGDETYLGLTRDDFDRSPFRRYAASQEDRIDTEHDQVQLRWFAQLGRGVDLTATAYDNDFFRNWFKLDQVDGIDIAKVVDDPAVYPDALAILRGEADSAPDALRNKNNRRRYFGRGAQAVAAWNTSWSETTHLLELGLRIHEDEEDRYQDREYFQMLAGDMVRTRVDAPGSDANRISAAKAIAFFVHDEIAWRRLTLTPGVRLESIDFERRDFGRDDPRRLGTSLVVRENSVDQWIPGVGANFRLDEKSRVFGGIHMGFAPPGPGDDERVAPEKSTNYELGYERASPRSRAQLVAFYSDYDNLLGTDTLSTGGTGSGDLFNGGAVRLWGLELTASADLAPLGASFQLPVSLAYTYTTSEFGTSFETAFEDWAPRVEAGDALPFLPEHMIFGSVGYERGRLAINMEITHVSAMRTKAGSGPIPEGERIDAHTVIDVAAQLRLSKHIEVFTQVRNVTDEVYVAARRPAGLRPGLPLQWSVGVGVDF